MEKEKSSVEVKAEKWMKENGFQFLVLKQYISKTIYEIEKDGFKTKFELPKSRTRSGSVMQPNSFSCLVCRKIV